MKCGKMLLASQPATVPQGEEGVRLDPFDEHEGVKGVDNAVDEVHVTLGADVVSAQDKRDYGHGRDELQQH